MRIRYNMKNLRRMRRRIEQEIDRGKKRQLFSEYEDCLAEIESEENLFS